MILSKSQLLEFRLEIESLICEREGMIALNKERERNDFALAYSEDSFLILGKKFEEIHNHMVHLMDR